MNPSKQFSDRSDHMETKFSFCQRSATIAATANDRNDHDRWDRIGVYLLDHQQSQRFDGNHQYSNCNDHSDRNDHPDHMETIAQQ